MLTIDRLTDKLSSSIVIAALSGLVVLPLAWHLLVAYKNDSKSQHGSRKVVRPSTTKPLLGITLDVIGNVPIRHDWITGLCLEAKGEPVLLQYLGTPGMTLLSTPQAFEDVFKNQFDNFPKGPKKAEYLRELLGEGIFAVDHEKWYRQRKTASNLHNESSSRFHDEYDSASLGRLGADLPPGSGDQRNGGYVPASQSFYHGGIHGDRLWGAHELSGC
ncbi:putative cytochrome P450 [Phytophthora infestans]|uniref:Putative cytochrome P450 n=1 Tax=Phytophthora infestans TaxID=4787 RepID=A0A8S9UFK7_PHYIN|nr:putative cytochrome P450 [Phytophthora infestans]